MVSRTTFGPWRGRRWMPTVSSRRTVFPFSSNPLGLPRDARTRRPGSAAAGESGRRDRWGEVEERGQIWKNSEKLKKLEKFGRIGRIWKILKNLKKWAFLVSRSSSMDGQVCLSPASKIVSGTSFREVRASKNLAVTRIRATGKARQAHPPVELLERKTLVFDSKES